MFKHHKRILNIRLLRNFIPKLYFSIVVFIRTYFSSNFWQQISCSELMGLILMQVVIVSVYIICYFKLNRKFLFLI